MTREYRDPYTGSKTEGITFTQPSMALQSAAAECDIYNIIKQFNTTGLVTHVAQGTPQYGDVSDVPDYQAALEVIMTAEEQFGALPANVRREFDNDPGKMLEFIHNPNNYERGVELGLFTPRMSDLHSDSSPISPEGDISPVVPPSPAAE